MKLYRNILNQSWKLTIKHPKLWIFGLFAALLIGNGGEIDRYWRYSAALTQQTGLINPLGWSQQAWFQILQRLPNQPFTWIVIGGVIFLLLVIVYMAVISQGSLIQAAITRRIGSYSQLFWKGQQHVITLFFLNVISYLTIALGVLLGSLWLHWASLIILIPFVLLISLLVKYAANYIVLYNQPLSAALYHSWKLLFKNLATTLVMVGITFGLVSIIILAVVIGVLLVLVPTFALGANQFYTTELIGVVFYPIVLVTVGAILSAWQWITWTLLFKKLESAPIAQVVRAQSL